MLWPGLLLVGVAFLFGAVPYGLIIARARGVDLRAIGSGNIGATNAARALGKKLGLLVLLLDVLKGLLPALMARWLLPASDPQRDFWIGATMVAAVAGHAFTPFLRCRGGKGVATGLGVILATCPLAGLIGMVVYAGLYARFRISSVGSLAGSLAAPLAMLLLGQPRPRWVAALFVFAIILAKHHQNIRRLLHGEEGKL